MSLANILQISASALSAQSQRLNTVASNLANADSVAGPDGKPYKARQVVFQSVQVPGASPAAAGVQVSGVTESQAAARRVYDPKNPAANAAGYVELSNVNVAEEMVNMVAAARSYQTNADVMNTARSLLQKTLTLGN